MPTPFELLPPNQFGPIALGCSPDDVRHVYGQNLTWEEWMGGNCNNCLYYPGLLFSFDICDSKKPLPHARLLSISCEGRSDVSFRKCLLISWQGDELERQLAKEAVQFVRHDDWIDVPAWNLELSLDEFQNCDGFYLSLPSETLLRK